MDAECDRCRLSPLPSATAVRPVFKQLVRSCARYMGYSEQHAAAGSYDGHPVEQLADIRRQVGELIWALEMAAAPAGADVAPPAEQLRRRFPIRHEADEVGSTWRGLRGRRASSSRRAPERRRRYVNCVKPLLSNAFVKFVNVVTVQP